MRHQVKGRKLNRDAQHRKALFKNLITALILNGQIKTTEAKAKTVKGLFDKLMTHAKKATLNQRRLIDQALNKREIVNKLVDEIAPVSKRTSGYTRIVRIGRRLGDDAMMVRLELVDQVVKKDLKATEKAGTKTVKKSKDSTEKVTKPKEAKLPNAPLSQNLPKPMAAPAVKVTTRQKSGAK